VLMVIKTNSQKVMVTLLALILLVFTGCQTSTESTDSEVVVLSTTEQVLGFATLSAVEELRQEVIVEEANGKSLDEQIESKMYVANTFLSDTAEFSVDVREGSVQGYEKTMVITYVDMNKNVNTHEFHYNETIVEVEDDEIESLITGVIIVNGVEYTLTGTKEEEEEEYEYDLIASLDDENYITIKYEVEESASEIEKEFEYERFVDKQLVYRMEIEFEVEEDGEREITIKLLDGDFESEYSFESELVDGREEIKIEYKTSRAGVVIEEGEQYYNKELNE
jgi:hypothetical protein